MQAAGPVTNQGPTLSASPALNATLSFPSNMVQISTTVDFSVSGLNRNQRAIADNLEAGVWRGRRRVIPGAARPPQHRRSRRLQSALNQLSPEVMSDAQISALYASLGFANSLLELPRQRRHHRRHHPRGPVPVGRRQRGLPRPGHDLAARSASTSRPACSRPARRSRSTMSGGSASAPATSRARSTPRRAPPARASRRKEASRSNTIPGRSSWPASSTAAAAGTTRRGPCRSAASAGSAQSNSRDRHL